jgi:hypothetical protein
MIYEALTILIEMTPAINNTAVIPFVSIGGKKRRGSTS